MIDEINYFPERENYQKKKKITDEWKDLKKQKTINNSQKTKSSLDKNKPEPKPSNKARKKK